jgi:hypothetical protein
LLIRYDAGQATGGGRLGIRFIRKTNRYKEERNNTPLKPPNWFARDCAPTAQSKSKKYLRTMCSSRGEWLAISEILARHPHWRRRINKASLLRVARLPRA